MVHITPNMNWYNLNVSHFEEYFKAINNPDSVFFQPDDDAVEFNERYLNGELQLVFDDLNSDISDAEIFKACRELSICKSGGSDFVLRMSAGYNYLFKLFFLHHFFASKIYNRTFNTKIAIG